MEINNNRFTAEKINWEELAGIGILKEELEKEGELETLLAGNKTKPVSLNLVLLGVEVVMDATLQIINQADSNDPLIEIVGIKPAMDS